MSRANPQTLLRDGMMAARSGNKALARQSLREVTEQEPGNELAWLWLAGVADAPQDAMTYLQRVLAINPENDSARKGLQQARLQAGIAEAKGRNKRTARRLLYEVTQQDPNCELALLWLAGVAETPQDAVALLERILVINPGNQHARNGLNSTRLQLGIAEARAGHRDAARRCLLAVTEQDPGNEQAWHWLAGVAESAQDAIGCLERVLHINPDNERAREALRWYQTQLKGAVGWQCPLCQEEAAETPATCPACQAILTLDNVDHFFERSAARPDQLEEAVARYTEELTTKATFAAHYHLGLALLNLQRLDDAVTQFEAALDLVPEHKALRTQLAVLTQRQRALAEQAQHERANRKRILVVDDSPTVRKLVTMTLEKQDYRVTTAANGEEAMRCLDTELPHLVLLDITMPGLDGYQVCKLIRGNRATAHIPVIMLSGKDGFFDKIRGRMAGSTAYITKPFNPEALLQLAGKHCPPADTLSTSPKR